VRSSSLHCRCQTLQVQFSLYEVRDLFHNLPNRLRSCSASSTNRGIDFIGTVGTVSQDIVTSFVILVVTWLYLLSNSFFVFSISAHAPLSIAYTALA
jgi:hypothetical protein